MSVILSEKLNLRLNGYPIVLNRQLNVPDLTAHDVKRVGFWGRLLLRHAKGEVIYWSKTCTLTYIDSQSDNSIKPPGRKDSQPEGFYDTSAFLHYTRGMLTGFAFQIMNNPAQAATLIQVFEEKTVKLVGEPSTSEGLIKTWALGSERLILDYPEDKRNGYIHLIGSN